MYILICSAEETTREIIKLMISDHYNLFLINDTEQALHTLSNHDKITLILIDDSMLKDISKKMASQFPNIKIISLADSRAPKTKKNTSAQAHIAKPFKAEQILEAIKSIL